MKILLIIISVVLGLAILLFITLQIFFDLIKKLHDKDVILAVQVQSLRQEPVSRNTSI